MIHRILFLIFGFFSLLISCIKNSGDQNNQNPSVDSLNVGLIAFYPFNNSSQDESGNDHHLTVKNAVLSRDRFGNSNKAFLFNGVNSFLEIPKFKNADSLRNFTIALWVNQENIYNLHILSMGHSAGGIFCSSTLGFLYENGSFRTLHKVVTRLDANNCTAAMTSDSVPSPIGKWTQVVLVQKYQVVNSALTQYQYFQYFNGKRLEKLGGYGLNPSAISFAMGGAIGCNIAGLYDFFQGSIDDIRIYNRALSDEEVLQLYQQTQ